MYALCQAISKGECSLDLGMRKPGQIYHARWLTKAIRILRLYVATPTPSSNVSELTTFVCKVYAPIWFSIKLAESCVDGPKHLLKMIRYSSYLPLHLKNIVYEVIQRNAYFAHQENVLLAMMTDL